MQGVWPSEVAQIPAQIGNLEVQVEICASSSLMDWLTPNPTCSLCHDGTPSKLVDPFTYMCPPFLYTSAVEKHHEQDDLEWPPPIFCHSTLLFG